MDSLWPLLVGGLTLLIGFLGIKLRKASSDAGKARARLMIVEAEEAVRDDSKVREAEEKASETIEDAVRDAADDRKLWAEGVLSDPDLSTRPDDPEGS